MNKKILPLVSIVICTLNCNDYLKRCLESIKKQDYPEKKIEVVVVDSYSTDGTIETAKSFGAKVILTKKRGYMEGKGMPKSIGCSKSRGEIVITIDSDNSMLEKNWISNMVYPLLHDKEVDYCICRMAVVKDDAFINQYLSLVGTDPFAVYCSLDPQISLGNVSLEDRGRYLVYRNTAKNFYITGGYYLAFKKETLNKIGGYSRDVDVAYEMASRKNGAVIAIPKDTHLHHLIATSSINFLKKKIKWGGYYFSNKEKEERKFKWNSGIFGKFGKIRFGYETFNNLAFFPAFFVSIKMLCKDKNKAWLLHPFMKYATTLAYIIAFIKTR